MNSSFTSFIYFYSKFTEEFLLLSAAGIFSLLAVYCYHWVIKKRRLGAARNQVPAGMVKAYLNQLIGEAQFVRTQLFGLIANGENPENVASFQKVFLKSNSESPLHEPHSADGDSSALSGDLAERLNALQAQLTEKESMVVNVNVEKTKLLEELENLKKNAKNAGPAAITGNSEELTKKIKSLEERLDEYALFEDDLANLKRLQQENAQLKKRLEEMGASSASPVRSEEEVAATTPKKKEPKIETTNAETQSMLKDSANFSLDQDAIESLLDGVTPSSPNAKTTESRAEPAQAANASPESAINASPAAEKTAEANVTPIVPIAAQPATSLPPKPEAASEPVAAVEASPAKTGPEPVPSTGPSTEAPPIAQTATAPASDDFEKLVDSVENSLENLVAAPKDEALANKTDEELLKEFENLLNS